MQKKVTQPEQEISLAEIVGKVKEILGYLLKKWVTIVVVGIIGAALGIGYAFLQPVKYVSRLTFVAEENKSAAGGLAALAGQFGFDIGGSSGGGVFAGDNILLFLKSESLCRETLLTNYDSVGSQTLADRYAEVNDMKQKWAKDKEIGAVSFAKPAGTNGLSRLQDSLLQIITRRILEKELSVSKPDKKASFIEVIVTTKDEMLSKYFGERLVEIATDRYVESKTKIKALNVARLQWRADSLGALLNSRTFTAAATQQSLVDANPALRMAPVSAEISSRNKTIAATIFAEVTKNLEIAKVALSQETPTIQMVDQSSLPLKKQKVKKLGALVTGGAMAGVLCVLFLLLRWWWRTQMAPQQANTKASN